jgi:geranylgeranyl diphosphate synthase type I
VSNPKIDLDDSQLSVYESHDSIQVELMAEAVIAVDERDSVIGPISKHESHFGAGAFHRAFSVLLFNNDGKLLLQKRSTKKVTFPGVWANSCCSHPLHSNEEMDEHDENGIKNAAIRKMGQELGISSNELQIKKFHFMTKMRYACRMDENWIEREIDHILFIQTDVELQINENEVEQVRWVSRNELEEMLIDEGNDIIAPWFRCIAARIMTEEWWECAETRTSPEALRDHQIHDMGDISHMLPNSVGADLMTSIQEVKPLVESRIESSLRACRHGRLSDAMMHLILGGGKRLRATLPWLVAKAVGDSHSGILDVGAAIETVHNFTLVHDDIMDNDEVRRGRNAVHVEFDPPTAINAGDAMLAIAFERIVMAESVTNDDIVALVDRIAGMVRRVSEGQQLDIEFEDRIAVSEEDYFEMIEGKTAVMFETCAEIGARLSGAEQEIIDCMSEWGLALGLCFQLMDDLIDVLSDSETLGKPAGSDIAQGKRTLMVIHALSQPDSEAKQRLMLSLGKGEDVDESTLQISLKALNELGSIEYAKSKAEHYHQRAHACLDRIPDSPGMRALRELTDFQLSRIQ